MSKAGCRWAKWIQGYPNPLWRTIPLVWQKVCAPMVPWIVKCKNPIANNSHCHLVMELDHRHGQLNGGNPGWKHHHLLALLQRTKCQHQQACGFGGALDLGDLKWLNKFFYIFDLVLKIKRLKGWQCHQQTDANQGAAYGCASAWAFIFIKSFFL